MASPKTGNLINKYILRENRVNVISSVTGDVYTLTFNTNKDAESFVNNTHFVDKARQFITKLDKDWKRTKLKLQKRADSLNAKLEQNKKKTS